MSSRMWACIGNCPSASRIHECRPLVITKRGLQRVGAIHARSGCETSSARQTVVFRLWGPVLAFAVQSTKPARPSAPPGSSRQRNSAWASFWSCARIRSRTDSIVSWLKCCTSRVSGGGGVAQTFHDLLRSDPGKRAVQAMEQLIETQSVCTTSCNSTDRKIERPDACFSCRPDCGTGVKVLADSRSFC